MSKERELLGRVLVGAHGGDFFISNELLKEIHDLLNQPEQGPLTTPQGIEGYVKGYRKATEDLACEPLSDEAVGEILLKKEWRGFVELVRIIEKTHGITGVEDE